MEKQYANSNCCAEYGVRNSGRSQEQNRNLFNLFSLLVSAHLFAATKKKFHQVTSSRQLSSPQEKKTNPIVTLLLLVTFNLLENLCAMCLERVKSEFFFHFSFLICLFCAFVFLARRQSIHN